MKQHYFLKVFIGLVFMVAGGKSWGQTPYLMSSGNKTWDFAGTWTVSGSTYTGTDAGNWGSVGVIGTGNSVTTGTRTTKSSATIVTTTAGGFQKPSGSIQLLSTGTSTTPEAVAIDLLLDFTGRNAGTLSFDWAAIDNSSGTRPTSLRVFWSTDGTTFTEIVVAQLLDKESATAPSSGSVTSVALPTNFNNSATARLRFYNHAGSNVVGSGSRDKMQIDNVAITSTSATSSTSNIISNGSFAYPTNIDYTVNQENTDLNSANSLEVAQFDIQDGGGTTDTDVLATTLTAITFNITNHTNLRRLAIYDGSTELAEAAVSGSSLTFSSLAGLSASDGLSKTFSLRASFASAVTDNQQFSFTITSATANPSGSTFSSANAGGAVTSTTGDNNRIEVTATKLRFIQQPTNTSITVNMTPAVTVEADDANNNKDLDYVTNVDITSSGILSSSPQTATPTSGLATFSSIKHTATGTGLQLTAASGVLTNATSNTFDITNPQPEINVKQGSTNINSGGSYAFGSVVSGNSSSVITFTIENTGAADLNLTGTPKIVISGANSAEFTVDETLTVSPVTAGSSTTFTITFIPTTSGSKSATITIANNDADEGSYTFSLSGTSITSIASDIIAKAGYTYIENIPYKDHQTIDIDNTSSSIEIAQFTIRDGGASADADNLGTTLNQLVLTVSNPANIRRIAIYDGATEIAEQGGAASVTFSGLTLTAADGGTKDFSVRVSYNSTVTDNQNTVLSVTATTSAEITGSTFAATNAGGAVTSSIGDNNKIEVTADRLAFVVQPSNTAANSNMTPAVTVKAIDVNLNTDLDFEGNIDITSTGTLDATPKTSTAVLGLASFSTIKHTQQGVGFALSATSTGLTGATSNTFNVTAAVIAGWDFTGVGSTSISTLAATTFSSNLVSSSGADNITRGTGAPWSNANNSWRTAGFQNNGISTANTDYFQTTLKAAAGKLLSVSTISANVAGTASFAADPGVSNQFAYSVDGTNFTLIGSPTVIIGTPGSFSVDVSGISALQNVPNSINITFRYYASGQTTTGGWGFNSPSAGINGLAFAGSLNDYTSVITDHFRTLASGNWSDAATWQSSPDNTNWYNAAVAPDFNANTIAVRNAHTVLLNDQRIIDQLTISAGGVLNVSPTTSLTLNDGTSDDVTIAANGSLVLQSTSGGTARIAELAAGTIISGNITVERFIPTPKRTWRLLTAPVTGPTIKAAWQEDRNIATAGAASSEPATYGTLITSGSNHANAGTANAQGYDYIGGTGTPSIRVYTPGSWASTLPTTSSINAQQAYLLFIRGDRTVTSGVGTTTLRATGAYKNGASIAINGSASPTYVLIGNPYPSNLDFESIYQSNSSVIGRFFWIWDANLSTTGGYRLVQHTSGDNAAAIYESVPGGANTDLKTIQSGQGFFVVPSATGGTLNITEAHKTPNTTTTAIFRIGNGTAEKLNINLSHLNADNSLTLADGVQARYAAGYSNVVAAEDTYKPNNFNENLAILRNGKYLIVEGRPLINSADTTYLTLWNTTERNYQFEFKAANFTNASISAFLIDKYTNTTTPVSLNGNSTTINFTVNADAASKSIDRFMVVYRLSGTLPVSFTGIKASQKNTAIEVEWTVGTETNTESYQLEKSANGQQFSNTATVKSMGKSSYNWLDVAPFSGLNYYRIKATSTNGDVRYSAVARVNMTKGKGGITVYPNPIVGKNFSLQLSNKAKGSYTLRITNNIGQVVFNQIINHNGGSATQSIQLTSALQKGIYQLELKGEDGSEVTTKIINN